MLPWLLRCSHAGLGGPGNPPAQGTRAPGHGPSCVLWALLPLPTPEASVRPEGGSWASRVSGGKQEVRLENHLLGRALG